MTTGITEFPQTLPANTIVGNIRSIAGQASAIPIAVLGTVFAANVFATTDINVHGLTVGLGASSVSTNTAFGVSALASCTGGDQNTAFGYHALKSVTGTVLVNGRNNVAFGSYALELLTIGTQNCAIGNQVMQLMTSGSNNVGVGNGALDANISGSGNTAVGIDSQRLATGQNNTTLGVTALSNSTSGSGHVGIGAAALQSNVSGNSCTAIGFAAGKYELGSNAFYVDNQDRTNTAGDKANALMFGTFNAAAANQLLQINAKVSVGVMGVAPNTYALTAYCDSGAAGMSIIGRASDGTGIFTFFANNGSTQVGKLTGVAASFSVDSVAGTLILKGAGSTAATVTGANVVFSGTIKPAAGGYLSSDGTVGLTQASTSVTGKSITVKDGLVTVFA